MKIYTINLKFNLLTHIKKFILIFSFFNLSYQKNFNIFVYYSNFNPYPTMNVFFLVQMHLIVPRKIFWFLL